MTIWHAIVLGVVQGFTEFLPISSSGHLLMLPLLFRWPEQGLDFDVAVHVATLGAIVVALRQDVWHMLRVPRLLALVVCGTVPILVFGFVIPNNLIEAMRAPLPVAISLVVWGSALVIADVAARHHASLPHLRVMRIKQAFFMGCAQVLALIPGTSRSGITMTAGMVQGLGRQDAARFSFLLAIPAIAGAGILTLKDALEAGFNTPTTPLVAGMFAAFLSGMIAIQLLMFVARRASFMWFAVYRFILAGIIMLILL